jgi:hypothetical protein
MLLFLIPAAAGAQTQGSPRAEIETGPTATQADRLQTVPLPATEDVADALSAATAASLRLDTAVQHSTSAEKSRIRQYLWDMTGPATVIGAALKAGVDHVRDVPEEWDQKHGGYGRRLASIGGRFAVQTTVTHGLAAAMDRATSYRRCGCSGGARRVRHALLGTIADTRPEGGRTLAVPRIAGVYAGAFTQLAWRPGSADARDALRSGTAFILGSAIQNLAREFLGAKIPILAH